MQMGMNAPFNRADFSKMTLNKTTLEIRRIIQKAFVEANEKGTEAAAVPVVMMATESRINRNEDLIPQFHADRPFLFLIRDKLREAILFTGGVEKPYITTFTILPGTTITFLGPPSGSHLAASL